jgi:antirestriction protein ArdC
MSIQTEALGRAIGSQTMSNYPAIFAGLLEKGIPESEILPRENVFTFHAWKALGRSVRKGEHGVAVITWIATPERKDAETGEVKSRGGKFAKKTYVFHVSQTDPTVSR